MHHHFGLSALMRRKWCGFNESFFYRGVNVKGLIGFAEENGDFGLDTPWCEPRELVVFPV
jgi:hypothetical protein